MDKFVYSFDLRNVFPLWPPQTRGSERGLKNIDAKIINLPLPILV